MAAWAGINHVYSDSTFFRYDIELTRNDKESGNVGQKYQICVSTKHIFRTDSTSLYRLVWVVGG